ncbi:peptide/nickel transport system permease protein [Haloactinopolyspora alba]|uniref:Peptide/nickel transport system permease protein n=1 Tax=Haloactinopolyspora alba TaxID=648780 RepID=A0A2P8DVC4_9ACTN|nr:ABC transporter permease [Haloactinopolyspora alba]PSL01154.1 peptide/nickel transport system permease protein [Haloactinopolyspora alba]
MTAPETISTSSPRRLTWARRRRSAAQFWQQYRRNRGGMFGLVVLLLFVATALLAPWIVGQDALSVTRPPGAPLQGPSQAFLLGTDRSGRSVLDLIIWGSRVSLTVGFWATFISITFGALLGIAAGHFHGWISTVIMRVTDWFLVMPSLVLGVALAAVLGRSLTTIIIAIGVTAWPTTARLVRAQTLAVEARPYIERAHALGGGHWHVMSRHVLPNVMPIVLAQTTLMVGTAILTESTFAFLGLGDPTTASWGGTIQAARDVGAVSARMWWYILPPGIAIVLVVLAFTLCGRAIEGVLNPKLRERRS